MAERPEFFPEWAVNDVNLPNTGSINKQRPKISLREVGFDKGQEVSAEEYNWQFNNIGAWVEFLEQEIAEGISSTRDVNVNAGNGLTGGGNLAGDITITMGTPSTNSISSSNNTTLLSHTHALDLSGRTVNPGDGLTGGGSLGTDISLAVDNTVVRTSRQIIAGNGLTGAGDLSTDRTINLGTPGTVTATTSNAATSTSHTHAVDISSTTQKGIVQLNDTVDSTSTTLAATANVVRFVNDNANSKTPLTRQIIAGNGLTGAGDLSTDRTINLGTPGTVTATTSNAATSTSHTHAVDINGFFSGLNQSLTADGFQSLPGGLILQWGSGNSGAGGITTVTLPVTLPTGVFLISVSEGNSNGWGTPPQPTIHGSAIIDRSSFRVDTAVITTSGIPQRQSGVSFRWFVIGY